MAPVQRHNRGPVPKYAQETDYFTMEFIYDGVFMRTGGNRSYVNGRKVSYDYCEADVICMAMFGDLIKALGYERRGRINIYFLLPGMQINEDGLRLLSKDSDTTCIRAMVREGHRFLMFYLEHDDKIAAETQDDVIANPTTELPNVISPMNCSTDQEHESVLEQSNVSPSHADESRIEGTSTCKGRGKAKEEDDVCSDDESCDSDYVASLVDSDYDLEDGDADLFIDRKQNGAEKECKGKSKEVVEDDISEDDKLELPDSDEEDMKFNFKHFTDADMNAPKFHLGQVFTSIDQLRKAIREYSCKERLNITFPKNDKTRLGAKCNDGCPWYLYASYDNRTQSIMIKTFKDEHTCCKKWQVKAFTARYIAHKYVEKIRADEKITLKGFGSLVQQEWNMKEKRGKLGRARKIAHNIIYGDEIAQYNKLWDYGHELRRSNPGSTFFVELADDGQFQKCYFSFDACKRGFLSACRPVLFVDGTHLKTQFGGILLTAIGMDPNDCIFPIAFGVVEVENTKSWRWFLTAFKEDLGIVNTSRWSIMSDKQKGLIRAVKELFSDSEHRFCVRHLWQNFTKNFKGEILKNQLWRCARSTTTGQFRANMDQMLILNKEAHDWLDELDPKTWVRAYQREFPKCDVLLNNNCEVFNKYILEAREMPFLSMAQTIKGQIMARVYSKKEEAGKWHGTICPKIRKRLQRHVEAANTCTADPAGLGIFQVNDRGADFEVDIRLRTCSCKRWDLTGIPCCHGVAACRHDQIPPEEMVHSCYSIQTYLKAYEHIIMPCKDVAEWQRMYGREILPPPILKKKGRRKKNRRQQPEEKEGRAGRKMGRGGAVIHCSYCGAAGHNIGGCTDFKLGLKPKKKGKVVRAEPPVSSDSENEDPVLTQEQNMQTMGMSQPERTTYEAEAISTLIAETQSSQRPIVQPTALPENAFIQGNVQMQPRVQETTATIHGNVHRKREVLALAKLKAAAERRDVADQAKFDAAMAKLKEEENKLMLAAEQRKQELQEKRKVAEEKKKAMLEQKKLEAEARKRVAEEKKRKLKRRNLHLQRQKG
ncbi:uncharacterized protein [Triticum aestivum]|uniref:uncharacterized protein n=1 Tax=Triticum aestivum TaxID=4565 RepID=UPI001D00C0D2|nr:uncharacterized protein LOC123096034 [Triticum aestivum]